MGRWTARPIYELANLAIRTPLPKVVSLVKFGATAGTVGSELSGAYGKLTLNADGGYTYVVDDTNATVQALRLSTDTLTEVFTYRVQDGSGAESETTLTITIHGANDAPVFTSGATGTVAENAPVSTVAYDAAVTDEGPRPESG